MVLSTLSFFGDDPPGRTRRTVHLIFEAAASRLKRLTAEAA
jgi:hypothetical protein